MWKSVWRKKMFPYALAAAAIFIATCNSKLGDAPIGPPVTPLAPTNPYNVRLTVSSFPTQIRANATDSSTITAMLVDANNSPLQGDTVYFHCSTVGARITDHAIVNSSGTATATLHGAPVNDSCVVIAYSTALKVADTTVVVFSGVTVALTANTATQLVGQNVTITASMTDASDAPTGSGDSITFTTNTGVFGNSATLYQTRLDLNGQATVSVTAATPRQVSVYSRVGALRDTVRLTFDSTSVPIVGTRQFHLFASKTQIKADNSDTATITATIVDQNNNPATGDSVFFTCNIGIIGRVAVVDVNGDAKVRLRAVPVNGVCVIKARDAKTNDTASTYVIFSGVTLTLQSDVNALKTGDSATVSATMKDGSGNAINGDSVVFSTRSPARFENGSATFRGLLDPNGRASVKVTSGTSSQVQVTASCLNTFDTMSIVFTNNSLTLLAAKDTLIVGGVDQTLLTAHFVDSASHPVKNVTITFSTNAGTIATRQVVTDDSGNAVTTLQSATFSGTATIEAYTTGAYAVHNVLFITAIPKRIKLAVTPDNIHVNGGIATLMATVTDSNGNMVSGVNVNFMLLLGPGGGEAIDKPVVMTQNGTAQTQLVAGTVSSMYRGVTVVATIGPIGDTAKLTISGEPYAISVARPQDDTITVPDAGQMNPATFNFNIGAVVVDINGNPVADGTQVNFSAVVSGMAVHFQIFKKWQGTGEDAAPILEWRYKDVPFEDINNNFRKDAGDLNLNNDNISSRGDDVNGDGVCDFNPAVHDLWFDFNRNGRVDTGTYFTTIVRDTFSVVNTSHVRDTVYKVHCRNQFDTSGCTQTLVKNPADTTKDTLIWLCTIKRDTVCDDSIVQIAYHSKDTVFFKDTIIKQDWTGSEPYIYTDSSYSKVVWADLYPDGKFNTTELIRHLDTNSSVVDTPANGDRRWWEQETLPFWFRQPFNFDQNNFGVAITSSAVTTGGVANVSITYPRQLARRLFVSVNAESHGVSDQYGTRFILPVIVQ